MAAQLTFVFRKAFNCRHNISFSGREPFGSLSTMVWATSRTYCRSCPSRAISAIFQIESNAALLGSFQITRPAKFQICFGYLETIVRAYHNLQTFPGIFRQFITGHQNTIRLVGSAPLHDHGADEAGKVRNVRHSLLSSRKR